MSFKLDPSSWKTTKTSGKCPLTQRKESATYQAAEAQSGEAAGDGSAVVAGDPEDLRVLVQAWEGMCVHLRISVQTLLPPMGGR